MKLLKDLSNNEYNTALKLKKLGYLQGPSICKCGNKNFTIQINSSRKILILDGGLPTMNAKLN